jgi:3-(methylthio)propanoyl-CoA dehydrogenase
VAAEYLQNGVDDADFYKAKIATARFYADHILSQATGVRNSIVDGSAGVLAMSESQF